MDLAPLEKFKRKVEKINFESLGIFAIRSVMISLYDEVNTYYSGATVGMVDTESSKDHARMTVNINYPNLWFEEFGTGYVGASQPYMGELPTRTLTFTSRGETQTTSGWEYAYHPDTKRDGYWIYDGKKQYGQVGTAGVAKTVATLRYRGVPHIAEDLRKWV